MSDNEQRKLSEFINCLSILESQTSLLYKNISDRVDNPLIKTFLEEISIDSQKHSGLLEGVSESIAHPKADQKDCAKRNEILQRVIKLQKETAKKQNFTSKDLLNFNERLQLLESQLGEEYYVFVQMKTLEFMMKQIDQAYNIDLTSVKRIFTGIISDEERHIEILATIKKMVTPKEQENNNPLVKFQNPDAWYQPPASVL
jgi:rubrerythrin